MHKRNALKFNDLEKLLRFPVKFMEVSISTGISCTEFEWIGWFVKKKWNEIKVSASARVSASGADQSDGEKEMERKQQRGKKKDWR